MCLHQRWNLACCDTSINAAKTSSNLCIWRVLTEHVLTAALVLGIYKFNTSRTGQQASEHLASGSNPGFWICGQNPLRQPLIPKHAAAADEIC